MERVEGLSSGGSEGMFWCSEKGGFLTESVSLFNWFFGLSFHFSGDACLDVI